jgi:type II secretory ATPase GspE/PulE/Tfp pilus assembly ATPase PilB-like protein
VQTPDLALLAGKPEGQTLGKPVGCPACLNTGFRGVAPAFELLTVGESLRPLLKPGVSDAEWLKAAQADGMTPFRENLVRLVLEGLTSLAEAKRWGLAA